jgi:hypothetical protein
MITFLLLSVFRHFYTKLYSKYNLLVVSVGPSDAHMSRDMLQPSVCDLTPDSQQSIRNS